MKILLLYKQSTYKHYFLNSGRMASPFKKNAAIAKRFINTHLEHYCTLKKVENFLKVQGISYKKVLRGYQKDFSGFDLIVTIGGDGTFLEGASQVTTQMMLGINSDPQWSVGRFCLANSYNFKEIIFNILAHKAKIQSLNRMKISLCKSKESAIVLNDILVCHRNPATMSRYFLEFKGQLEEQRSSGVWVATAAGSTGAIHSAGGKVFSEKSKNLQFVVREPYCGKIGKIKYRTAVFSEKSPLKITSLMTGGVIYIDGSHINLSFGFGEELLIKNSIYPLNLVVA